jgi:hypothetical protein
MAGQHFVYWWPLRIAIPHLISVLSDNLGEPGRASTCFKRRRNIFTIHATKVDNAPPFNALSYTWDNPASPCIKPRSTEPHAFQVASFPATYNGLTLTIRPNLRDALRILQTTSFASLGRNKQKYI